MQHQPMYRNDLPQLRGATLFVDGGLETTLVFEEKMDLPCFAAFPLMDRDEGRAFLARFCAGFIEVARRSGAGLMLCTPTWRASRDWGAQLGYGAQDVRRINRESVEFMRDLRERTSGVDPIVICGAIGPRGDGYRAEDVMSVDEAQAYHAEQVEAFAGTACDLVTAFTMTNVNEAAGIARAAAAVRMPCAISFTVETDGRLPSGDSLAEAIERVDAATGSAPAYYMINCAHPTHFAHVFEGGGAWRTRIRGVLGNASRLSHAELDCCTTLDSGDPRDFAQRTLALRAMLPNLSVLGGCCGTDVRHVAAIAEALAGQAAA